MDSHLNTPVLQAAIDTLIDSAVVIDAAGIIVRVNDMCLETFQYNLEDLTGKNISCLMPEPYRSHHDAYIDNYHRSGEAKIIKIGREVIGLRSDGSEFPMHLAVGEMQIEGNRHYLGIIRNLTDLKEKQSAFEDLQSHHFHLSRIAAMNEMGTAIAHEINQPLAAAANYLETAKILLDRANSEGLSYGFQQAVELMSKSGDQNRRASEIVSRMRRFIEHGDIRPDNFDLSESFKDTISLSISKLMLSEIDLAIDIADNAKWVFADPIHVQQVLVNLIRNAVEAMENSPQKQLKISVFKDQNDPDYVKLSVSDSGSGIDPKMRSSVFSAFESSKPGGLGVGLSISRSILSAMGGRIWVSDNPQGGAVFSFTLPTGQPA